MYATFRNTGMHARRPMIHAPMAALRTPRAAKNLPKYYRTHISTYVHCKCYGQQVPLTLSLQHGLAPAASSSPTSSVWSHTTARCSGVDPSWGAPASQHTYVTSHLCTAVHGILIRVQRMYGTYSMACGHVTYRRQTGKSTIT